MVATSAFCAGRLVASRRWEDPTQRDVDAVHVVTMSDMLIVLR